MNRDELRLRTKQFAIRIIRMAAALPNNRVGSILARQIIRSGTSIGANYREALRASSRRQFISTLEIALREADESMYWLELLTEAEIIKPSLLANLIAECESFVKILASTSKSAKRNSKKLPPTDPSNPKSPNPKSPN